VKEIGRVLKSENQWRKLGLCTSAEAEGDHNPRHTTESHYDILRYGRLKDQHVVLIESHHQPLVFLYRFSLDPNLPL